jgi:hypothetical protein
MAVFSGRTAIFRLAYWVTSWIESRLGEDFVTWSANVTSKNLSM